MLISINDAIARQSIRQRAFKPDWEVLAQRVGESELRPITDDTGPITDWMVRHSTMGVQFASRVTALPDGTPMWDQPLITEPTPGVVIVPYFLVDRIPRVVLLREMRPVVRNGEGGDGAELWAVPRGFRSPEESAEAAALRELAEETGGANRDTGAPVEGLAGLKVELLGEVNPNTSFVPVGAQMLAVEVDPLEGPRHLTPKPWEPVSEVRAFTLGELFTTTLVCGFTMSALFAFTAHATRQGWSVLADD